MRYRTLGRTGVQVSVIGLGGNMFGNPVDAAGTKAVIDQAQSLGINFIDTAESYANGRSEELLGKALAGRRDEFVLATKTGQRREPGWEAGGRLTRKRIVERLEASLRRLGTDYVDLYYFHFPDPLTPLEESLRAVDDLIRAGKVRYLATSNEPAWELAEMVGIADRRGYGAPVASQHAYNLLNRSVERETLPACAHFGISLVPYSPLAGGFLTGKYRKGAPLPAGSRFGRGVRFGVEVLSDRSFASLERYAAFAAARGRSVGELALAWLLVCPQVCSIIAGNTSAEQVAENVRAAEWGLTPEEVGELA